MSMADKTSKTCLFCGATQSAASTDKWRSVYYTNHELSKYGEVCEVCVENITKGFDEVKVVFTRVGPQ